jgi:hypothetical protein
MRMDRIIDEAALGLNKHLMKVDKLSRREKLGYVQTSAYLLSLRLQKNNESYFVISAAAAAAAAAAARRFSSVSSLRIFLFRGFPLPPPQAGSSLPQRTTDEKRRRRWP